MPLEAYFLGMPAAIPCFLCPLSLTWDALNAYFLGNACSHSLFFMPLSLTWDALKRLCFKECLQPFLGFYAL